MLWAGVTQERQKPVLVLTMLSSASPRSRFPDLFILLAQAGRGVFRVANARSHD